VRYVKKFIILFFSAVIFPLTAGAGSFGIGKYAGEFISIGVGGRALGLGSAYVAIAHDVTAGYWNPAGLSRITYPEIILMHDERYGGLMNYDYGAVALPYGSNASVGISVMRLGIDGIPDTRNALIDHYGGGILDDAARLDYDKITEHNWADWVIYLTYSMRRSDRLSYGFNVKLVRRDFLEFHATGIGFDVGLWYNPVGNLYLGVNAQDITTTLVAWNTGTNDLVSPTLKLGSGYMFKALGGQFMPLVDLDVRFENRKFASNLNLGPVSVDLHTGMEYNLRNLFALRVGYNDIGNFTLGAGIYLPKLDLDYSFAQFDGSGELGNTHRISLRITLSDERFARKTN
jgi:hypothetical protein